MNLLLPHIIIQYKEKEKTTEPPGVILESTLKILKNSYQNEFLRIRSGALAVSLCLQEIFEIDKNFIHY